MATKAQIEAIFANVATGQPNTAVEALANWNALKNELYPTKASDTHSTTNVLTKVYADIEYIVNFKKVGNTVFIWGYVENIGNSINGLTNLANITNSVYVPASGEDFFFKATRLNGASDIFLSFSYGSPNENFTTRSTIPTTNVKYYFNTSYTVAS